MAAAAKESVRQCVSVARNGSSSEQKTHVEPRVLHPSLMVPVKLDVEIPQKFCDDQSSFGERQPKITSVLLRGDQRVRRVRVHTICLCSSSAPG